MSKGRQIVLTADRSLMSNYRQNMLYGFTAVMPAEKLSKFLYYHVFCPKVGANPATGETQYAPLGLRRIESSLMDEFGKDNVIIGHSEHIEKCIGEGTEVVGINAMDPLGNGPITTSICGDEYKSYASLMFSDLMGRIKKLQQKYGFKTVLGGTGAWQLHTKELRESYGIDHVVIGEADRHCVEMIYNVMNDGVPELMSVLTNKITDIPYIKAPTCCSTIEAMRGCGRGCDFCDPNLRRKRDFPIERLKQEADINLKNGFSYVYMLSDEIMLYGCDNKDLYPNRDAIVDLYSSLKNLGKVDWVGTPHVTFSSAVADPDCVRRIKEINNFGPDRWNGIQPGIETGSIRMFKRHMPYKSKPYSPEEWPAVVADGMKILNGNYLFTICTIVIGLPGETEDDVKDTINLIKEIDTSASVIAPTFWTDYNKPENSLTHDKFTKLQWKLYYLCWKVDLKTVVNWIWYGTSYFPPLIRQIAGISGKWGARHYLRVIRDTARNRLGEDPDFDLI